MYSRGLFCVALLALATAAPIDPANEAQKKALAERQTVTTPVGVNADLTGLSEFSPIEDGFLEFDNDSGGETENGGTANSVSNGLLGQGGAGSSSQTNGSATSSTSFCSLTGCTSGSGAANGQNASTSTSSSSLQLFGGPVVSVGNVGRSLLKLLRLA